MDSLHSPVVAIRHNARSLKQHTSSNHTATSTGRFHRTAISAALLALMLPLPAAAEFTPLGDLPGGVSGSDSAGISGDGSVVVGVSMGANGREAFRWTQSGSMAGLGDLPGGAFDSVANSVNSDGSVVVGFGVSASGTEAYRWTQAGGMVGLGDLPGGAFISNAISVNSDGSVVVGYSDSANGWESFRWTQAGGMVGLGDLPGGAFASYAYAVSSDGSVVVGKGLSANGFEAYRWTQASGMVVLDDLAGGAIFGLASGVNSDGSVVVGYGASADGQEAFRWTQAGGTVGLGDLPGGAFDSVAWGVNSDGSVVVGSGTTAAGLEAFRWTQADGMQTVTDWLTSTGVSVSAGYTLTYAAGISDDGTVIVGGATNDDGNQEAWLARAGSGVLAMDAQLQQSLAGTAASQGSEQAHSLILNGAHHRPLMDQPISVENNCFWVKGDLARYDHDDKDADTWIAEVGGCRAFGSAVAGIGIGKARMDQKLAFGGDSDSDGQYLIAELDYQREGQPWLLSFTGLYSRWDATINRGYLNGGLTDSSQGETNLSGASLRTRLDWPKLVETAGLSLTPRVQYSVSHSKMDGYTETGGGFPAIFDSQSHTDHELRVGARGEKELSAATTINLDVEGVHRFDDSYDRVSGQIIGLFTFDQDGTEIRQNWLRAGVELDHRFAKDRAISFSMVASSAGEDPDLSGAVSFHGVF